MRQKGRGLWRTRSDGFEPAGITDDAELRLASEFDFTRQAILYLGDVEPNKEYVFKYTLKPKYPVKAKTPSSTAYEYYTPEHRATAAPVELVVEEAKK